MASIINDSERIIHEYDNSAFESWRNKATPLVVQVVIMHVSIRFSRFIILFGSGCYIIWSTVGAKDVIEEILRTSCFSICDCARNLQRDPSRILT